MAKLTLLEQHRRVLRAMQRAQVVLSDCGGSVSIRSYCNEDKTYFSAAFTITLFDRSGAETRIRKQGHFDWTSITHGSFRKMWEEFLTAAMKEFQEEENNG